MKKVYILIGGCIDDRHIIGVYTTEKNAIETRKTLIKTDNYYKQFPNDLEIEPFTLNEIKKYF